MPDRTDFAVPQQFSGALGIGWDSGFHYYLLMFIPGIFVSTTGARAVAVVFGLWAFYVALNAMTYFVAPLEPLQPVARTASPSLLVARSPPGAAA